MTAWLLLILSWIAPAGADAPPAQVLTEPKEARTRQFLHRILDPI